MASYRVMYDAVQDAYNWYNAVVNFGQEGKLREAGDAEVMKRVRGMEFAEAKGILVPYLERAKRGQAEEFLAVAERQFGEYFEAGVEKLEAVTGRELAVKDCAKNRAGEVAKIDAGAMSPQEDLLILVTTFPAMIVYYEEGVIYSYAKIDDRLWGMPLDGILHELMHFQTNAYFRQNPRSAVSKLSEEEYYVLKESVPVLLDESWKPIITLPDCSYPEYGALREKLHEFYEWTGDFGAMMEYGAGEVVKFKKALG